NVGTGPGAPQQGRNGFGRIGWGGPCPPSGTHHYVFTLIALGAPLGLSSPPDRTTLDAAIAGHTVLGKARLTGTYRRD
ncbi:MAG TPA: YbhB/YbcL family Raf kinase inhibitor-like protein, partial [Candidatus Limnocylindrales bacterium]|nr:YbhB/YbcL family Raf kinase inhibitor-like protein [Candidatus Limnocylindrales bacterium]